MNKLAMTVNSKDKDNDNKNLTSSILKNTGAKFRATMASNRSVSYAGDDATGNVSKTPKNHDTKSGTDPSNNTASVLDQNQPDAKAQTESKLEYPLDEKRVDSRGQSIVYQEFKARRYQDKLKKLEIAAQQKELEKLFNEP